MVMRQKNTYAQNNSAQSRSREKSRNLNWACWMLVAVIFAGTFLQVFSLAQLMLQNKQIGDEYKVLEQMKDREKNARNALLQYTSSDSITRRAEAMGMIKAISDNCEIRRVPIQLAATESDTNAQTAFGGGN